MKTICLILLIIIATPVTFSSGNYAMIKDDPAYLYVSPDDSSDVKNIICVMEDTYYVEILNTFDEKFYRVNYNGATGYVLRSAVRKVDGIPNTPFPNFVTLKTVSNNTYLRSSPLKSNNALTIIPSNCTELEYIGYVYGEQVDDFRDNIWYYVKYLDIYGYIYGEYVTSISPIPQNVEQLSFLSDYEPLVNPLSNGLCILIVIVLTIPTFLILYLLYRKPKRKTKFKEHVIVVKEYDDKL